MIKTVVREHHWTPDVINSMYTDDRDHQGIRFWYNDIVEVIEQLKPKK